MLNLLCHASVPVDNAEKLTTPDGPSAGLSYPDGCWISRQPVTSEGTPFMPRHRIEISQPPKTVLHSDVVFTIWSDDTKLGELEISKGSVDWKSAKRRRAKQISWERLAAFWMRREQARGHLVRICRRLRSVTPLRWRYSAPAPSTGANWTTTASSSSSSASTVVVPIPASNRACNDSSKGGV